MLEVRLPRSFKAERTYIIEVILNEYLGLNMEFVFHEEKDYEIILPNKNSIIIRDYFFSNNFPNENYLDARNLPEQIIKVVNPFIVEKDIPVIYGSNEFTVESSKIICGIDIFASSYFMLTRWEEYVNKERDIHNRFPAIASISYKNNFLDRPVVNEYVEMLWKMLIYLGIDEERKSRQFQFIITHDIDHIKRWKSTFQLLKVLGGDLIKRHDVLLAKERILEYKNIKIGKQKDPFNTFEWLMDLSESANIKSRFYFMSGGLTKFDNHYDIDSKSVLEILSNITKRNHIIGFHPSYNSYNNPEQWIKEKKCIENKIENNITEGRQHFLRFQAPYTWQIWEDNGMQRDLTLSYADKEGFRCGTCFEYPVFNFLTKKRLSLKESPLIVMESTFTTYQNVSPTEMYEKTKKLLEKVEKYKGEFVYLWHNSSFNTKEWIQYTDVYKRIIELVKNQIV